MDCGPPPRFFFHTRKSMTPIIFEALVFLKVNTKYWDLKLVYEAMKVTRSVRVQQKLDEDAEHEM